LEWLNNNKLINPKLICAFCWFVLFLNYENARSKNQNIISSRGSEFTNTTCLSSFVHRPYTRQCICVPVTCHVDWSTVSLMATVLLNLVSLVFVSQATVLLNLTWKPLHQTSRGRLVRYSVFNAVTRSLTSWLHRARYTRLTGHNMQPLHWRRPAHLLRRYC